MMFKNRNKYCWSYVVMICLLFESNLLRGVNSQEDSPRHFHYYPGDIVLGGLFPIHFYDNEHCGEVNLFRGIQSLVSVLFALDKVNDILKPATGKRLGMVALDTCYITDNALEIALRFAENRYTEKTTPKPSHFPFADKIIGVLGPTASGDSVKVATLLKLFKFHRYFRWSYVSLLYEDSCYGRDIAEVLQELAEENDACAGFQRQVSESSSSADLEYLAFSLLEHSNTNNEIVVLLNARYNLAIRIIRAVHGVISKQHDSSKMKSIQWVTSDGLTGFDMPSDIQTTVDSSILGVTLSNQYLPGFIPYFKSFTRKAVNRSDPWIRSYWEYKFNCSFDNSSQADCSGGEDFVGDKDVKELGTLYNGRNAVYSFGQALLSVFSEFCDETRELCEPFERILSNGTALLRYIKNVEDPFNISFSFTNQTDGPARYSIMSFQNNSWYTVGNFTGKQGLSLDILSVSIPSAVHDVSTCSAVCPGGQYRQQDKDKKCCWKCAECIHKDTYVNSSNPSECTLCPEWYIPSPSGNFCEPIVIVSFSYSDPLPIFLCVISTVGIVGTLAALLVFLAYRASPIVKASSIGTSVLLLFGIILSFSFPFVAIHPSVASCVFTRIFLGLSYTVGYGAIFAKLFLLVSRIFRALRIRKSHNKSALRPSSMLPVHALMIAFGLIGAHSVFILSWTAIDFPEVPIIDTSNDGIPGRLRICSDASGMSYIGGLIWPFIIMIACCIFAVRLRKLPKAFNERISILYCTSISVILWTVFVPIYSFSTDNYLRIISMCFSLFFHGALLLLTIFGPKLHIILLKPERNTRESVMGFHSISISSTTGGLKDAQTQTSNDD